MGGTNRGQRVKNAFCLSIPQITRWLIWKMVLAKMPTITSQPTLLNPPWTECVISAAKSQTHTEPLFKLDRVLRADISDPVMETVGFIKPLCKSPKAGWCLSLTSTETILKYVYEETKDKAVFPYSLLWPFFHINISLLLPVFDYWTIVDFTDM